MSLDHALRIVALEDALAGLYERVERAEKVGHAIVSMIPEGQRGIRKLHTGFGSYHVEGRNGQKLHKGVLTKSEADALIASLKDVLPVDEDEALNDPGAAARHRQGSVPAAGEMLEELVP